MPLFRRRDMHIAVCLLFSPIIIPTLLAWTPLITTIVFWSYLLTWGVYLRYAQTDNHKAAGRLPYLPLSPIRVYKVTVAALGSLLFLGTRMLPIGVRWTIKKCFTKRSDSTGKVCEDICYGSARPDKRLDVFTSDPTGRNPGEPLTQNVTYPKRPVIIFIYGGAWNSGSKEMYRPMATTLQEKGYVVVVPTYSLYPIAYLAEMVSDIRAVVIWTHDHIRTYGGDPNNVYLMGHSAGAHLAAYTVIHDAVGSHVKFTKKHFLELSLPVYSTPLPRVQGLILLSGIFDTVDHYGFESRRGVEEVSAMARVMGTKTKLLRGSSPTYLLEAYNSKLVVNGKPLRSVPSHFLIIHGTKDHTVPVSSSRKFAQFLEKAGISHISLHILEGVDHSQLVTDLMLPTTAYAQKFLRLLERFVADSTLNPRRF
ncbi:hypothetical protein SeMB42_g03721 [Synchytrium endobioticum]|uniref:BD-FAE-like domain-containing protein n=1 Tax=Synchytrium endobioticum TaxID=286115 RepID=A0A507D3T4_9FUNG|nr:hypothetical protein SeLEV6574_g03530 [Synchytrium endobioticum]TPX46386.1 hypothetical protein SeMB42_g03721 [Synchytrium endobioticum]